MKVMDRGYITRTLCCLLITGIILITSGCTQVASPTGVPGNPGQPSGTSATLTPAPASSGRVIAAYWYLYPDPNDDTYPVVMPAKDQIPWKKINRLYIGFATVKDGTITDLPAGSSTEDTARRTEMQRRIREIVALARQNNPDLEIFITSNFDEKELDPQYLLAAQDPQKFADSVLSYLKTYDLDGYDMDWESRSIDDYAPQLTALLSACHTAFISAGPDPHGRSYKVTHAIWPGVESAQTVAGLAGVVDQVNIMSYGPGDTYDLVSYADAYHAAGFPYEKMIGGLEGEAGYGESGGHDTQDSIAAKCVYVKANNLAGLFVWRMDNDMRPDGKPPAYLVTGWMNECLAGR